MRARGGGGGGRGGGRRDPDRLRPGDALDFWRVEEVRTPAQDPACAVLRLRAEMRVPGRAWLEFRVEPGPGGGSRLTQRALFAPKGLFGRMYWWAVAPFHPLIFASMVTRLARDAEQVAPVAVPHSEASGSAAVATSSDAPTGPPEGLVERGVEPDPGPTPSQQAG